MIHARAAVLRAGLSRPRRIVNGGVAALARPILAFDLFRAGGAERLGRSLPYIVASAYFGDSLRLQVDPAHIVTTVPQDVRALHGPGLLSSPFLWGGDWDLRVGRLELDPRCVAMRDLWQAGLRYRETVAYREMVDRAVRGAPAIRRGKPLATVDRIDAFWEERVAIISDMQAHGYRQEIGAIHDDREIGIAVGREGALAKFRHGHHRLCIAQLVGVPLVTVRVELVHALWMDALKRGSGRSALEALRTGLGTLA